jgi:hypothetical protein
MIPSSLVATLLLDLPDFADFGRQDGYSEFANRYLGESQLVEKLVFQYHN